MPKVSVILPTYNCAGYLPESIESVLSQTFKDLELVVVDDGSVDSSEEIVRRYALKHPLVRYIKQDHKGLPAARNNGFDCACGEYITFIDADDIFLKNRIEKQVKMLQRRRDADAVYSAWKYFYDNDTNDTVPSPYERFSGDILFFLKRGNFIPIVTGMVRRSALGGMRFDESLKSHEDWDFWLKLSKEGKRFLCLGEELTLIRIRRDSMTYESSVMNSSRAIVGERAKLIWKEVKRRDPLRYLRLRLWARLIGFPGAPRFNRTLPFGK